MKGVLRKILLSTMIISFMWVIIGDLVNMHMKLIYKKDIYAHNTYYTKSHKSDKKNYKVSSKNLKKISLDFANSTNLFSNINISYTELLFSEIENIKITNLHISLLLRGPPALI